MLEAPTCAGFHKPHRDKVMKLIGSEDDGTAIWRCPRCLYVWRERPEIVALSTKRSS